LKPKNVAVAADELTTKIERRSCDNLTTISQAAGTPLPPVATISDDLEGSRFTAATSWTLG